MSLPILALEDVATFLAAQFPQIDGAFELEEVGPMRARLRMPFREQNLRPGGTVSGPAMFALADVALYAAVLANVGLVALAVTTNLNINFLIKPEPVDLVGEARLLKLGRRLAVGDVSIYAGSDLVAHASGTYSIPVR